MLKISLCVALNALAFAVAASDADQGGSVVVIYNSSVPESKDVADHYAERRNVPPGQVLGMDLSVGDTMSRAEYREQLELPLLKFLERRKLFVYVKPSVGGPQKDVVPVLAKIRYAVLCYGVPLRIAEDSSVIDPDATKIQEALRRNGAAVDSELCTLPIKNLSRSLTGPLPNRLYGAGRPSWLNPTNGLLMVTRLDGPSAAIARALVDKSMEAETNGLWGRAYFDARGLTNGPYKEGDDWIRAAAEKTRQFGFEVVLDDKPETFPAAFPMSQIALYAGWYDGSASGPFTRSHVEFMPGAFAYHLHSFSARTLRSRTENWCGPLLAAGASATMGCIDEPYLDGTPNIAMFFAAFLGGYNFGESAYACQKTVSWQTTVIGDPLYRPFGKVPKELHAALMRRHSKLVEWSDLQFVDKGLVLGASPAQMTQFLMQPDVPQESAVLSEKLAELDDRQGLPESCIKSLANALKFGPSPQQRVRVTLKLADKLTAAGRDAETLALLEDFLNGNPDYPDAIGIYTRMEALAAKMHRIYQAEQYARQIAKLSARK